MPLGDFVFGILGYRLHCGLTLASYMAVGELIPGFAAWLRSCVLVVSQYALVSR